MQPIAITTGLKRAGDFATTLKLVSARSGRGAPHPAYWVLAAALALAGCGERVGEYLPVSAIARGGFVGDDRTVAEVHGRDVRLWGFVDHGNLYGDVGVKRILGEWWSGEGPDADTWRFNLKAAADDAVGHSFPVHVPNDAGREDLLRRFVADARAGRPTKVFVQGKLLTFEAPTQVSNLTGLYLELGASRDIRHDNGRARSRF